MNGFTNKIHRIPAGLLCLVGLLSFVSTGCQTIQYESAYIKGQTAADQAAIRMSAGELRLRLDDLAGVFSGTIEQAADRVIAETADPAVERHALLWKINAIPMAYRALFQADPAVALIDTWAFSAQMAVYFEVGAGKDDLGEWHPIALDACRRLEATVADLVRQTRTDGNIEPFEPKIHAWVAEHPIQRDFVYRDTAIPILSSKTGQQKLGAVQTVGSLALSVEDIAFRLFLYMDLVTRQARWQTEYVMADTDKDAGIQSALRSMDDMVAAVNRITPVVENAPELVAGEREAALNALRQERVAAFANINQQRVDTLAYLTQERTAAIDELKTVQQTVTNLLQTEREAVLESIEAQRKALLIDIESTGHRIVENSLQQSRQVVDYFIIRVALLLAVFLLLAGVAAVIIRYRLQGKQRSNPSGSSPE